MVTEPDDKRSAHRLARKAAARSWRGSVASLLILLGFGHTPMAVPAEPVVQVILSTDHGDVQVDRKLLLSAYIGRITAWPDGRPMRVFALADDHPLHVRFCRQLLGTYPYVLRNAWNKLVYTGTGFAPTLVDSEQEMRRRVDETPGAIGYVSASSASGSSGPTNSVAMQASGAQQ